MKFQTQEDFAFYQHFYKNLTEKVFTKLLRGSSDDVTNISYKIWDLVGVDDLQKTFDGAGARYFYKYKGRAEKEDFFEVRDTRLSAALDFLEIKDSSKTLKAKLSRQIAAYREKYAIPSSDIYSEKSPEAPKREQFNPADAVSFKRLIGFTGTQNVYTILRKLYDSEKKLDNNNSYDGDTASIIMNLLENEQIQSTKKIVYTNEKRDKEATSRDPYEVIEIEDNDMFIVIGLYGYNLLPDVSQGSPFFQNLLFKWEDESGQTEFTTIHFKGTGSYTVEYANIEDHSGGISHGIFAKIKYKEYTYIQCGGVGQRGTGAMGIFIKQHWQSIYKLIFSKSSNPHSYAVLVELNLDDLSKSRILDSVTLTVS